MKKFNLSSVHTGNRLGVMVDMKMLECWPPQEHVEECDGTCAWSLSICVPDDFMYRECGAEDMEPAS